MRSLFESMQEWQTKEQKRLLSINTMREGDGFSCIALTNPTEVVITDATGKRYCGMAGYGSDGILMVTAI